MFDGWKRLIRKLEDSRGYISLMVDGEDLGSLEQGIWASPTLGTVIRNNDKFAYEGGQVVYKGQEDVIVRLNYYQSVELDGVVQATVAGTCGVNSVVDDTYTISNSSTFGGNIDVINEATLEISNGDTIDVFIKQDTQAQANVTIVKGLYHIQIIDVI